MHSIEEKFEYQAVKERMIHELRKAIEAHEKGDFNAIELGFEEMDEILPRKGHNEFDKLHIALNFWDGWIDSRNHNWQYYDGIEMNAWPVLARRIIQDLEGESEIKTELVLKHFAFGKS